VFTSRRHRPFSTRARKQLKSAQEFIATFRNKITTAICERQMRAKKRVNGALKTVLGERAYRELEKMRQMQNPMVLYRQKQREMKAIRQHNEHFFRAMGTVAMAVAMWRVAAEVKDFSESGLSKRSVSRKAEKELLAGAMGTAALIHLLTTRRPLDAVGISKQLAKSASNDYKGLSEVLGTPLRVNESVYSQTTRSEHLQGRGNKAIVTRHACVISGTKGDGVLSFLCVENGSGSLVSMANTKFSSSNSDSNNASGPGDVPSSFPKSIPQILTSEQVAEHTTTAMKSVSGFFTRSLLENDTSSVTVARIDVFPNDDDVEIEHDEDDTTSTTSCKKYTPALTTYLKGSERLDGEDLALHHARESVRRFGLGRRTIASVIDFSRNASDEGEASSFVTKVSSNEDLKTCIALADAKATEVKFTENAVIRKEKREVRKEKLKKVGRSLRHLPY
jgi:hypothetical protein